MDIDCENYKSGMCVYVPEHLEIAVFQECLYGLIIKIEKDRECTCKTLIKKLQAQDKSLKEKLDKNF